MAEQPDLLHLFKYAVIFQTLLRELNDDVKYARRDWDENVRMLKDDDQRISIRFAPYLAWTSLIHLSHGQSFIGDEEFVILVAFNRAKKRST